MKTFLILSETHDGGLILQPWGRDRPDCNSDVSYGPRILPTATGAILLALGEGRLQITGADMKASAADSTKGTKGKKPLPATKAPVRKPSPGGAAKPPAGASASDGPAPVADKPGPVKPAIPEKPETPAGESEQPASKFKPGDVDESGNVVWPTLP